MEFEWNTIKELANFKKHGIWFIEARTLWQDSKSLEFFDEEHSIQEDRYLRLGHSSKGRLLLVVFCERENGNIIRVISARKASDKERSVYEERV